VRACVQAAFVPFITPFEGSTNWMYCDVKGLVTTGIGNLIDPFQTAIHLPWIVGQRLATEQEIITAWRFVKDNQDLKLQGGGAYKSLTQLRLTDKAVSDLVAKRLASMDSILCSRFYGYEFYPANAQLGILSMAWALGPNFWFPTFKAACERGDWTTAANECHISDANPARNTANKALFLAAVTSGPDDLALP
jgi:GH24 family phage-related lysozyme (muramidase)